jgi:hypothetical protein
MHRFADALFYCHTYPNAINAELLESILNGGPQHEDILQFPGCSFK